MCALYTSSSHRRSGWAKSLNHFRIQSTHTHNTPSWKIFKLSAVATYFGNFSRSLLPAVRPQSVFHPFASVYGRLPTDSERYSTVLMNSGLLRFSILLPHVIRYMVAFLRSPVWLIVCAFVWSFPSTSLCSLFFCSLAPRCCTYTYRLHHNYKQWNIAVLTQLHQRNVRLCHFVYDCLALHFPSICFDVFESAQLLCIYFHFFCIGAESASIMSNCLCASVVRH